MKMTIIVLALSAAIVAIPAFLPQAIPPATLPAPHDAAFTSCQVDGVDYRVENRDLICAPSAHATVHSTVIAISPSK